MPAGFRRARAFARALSRLVTPCSPGAPRHLDPRSGLSTPALHRPHGDRCCGGSPGSAGRSAEKGVACAHHDGGHHDVLGRRLPAEESVPPLSSASEWPAGLLRSPPVRRSDRPLRRAPGHCAPGAHRAPDPRESLSPLDRRRPAAGHRRRQLATCLCRPRGRDRGAARPGRPRLTLCPLRARRSLPSR